MKNLVIILVAVVAVVNSAVQLPNLGGFIGNVVGSKPDSSPDGDGGAPVGGLLGVDGFIPTNIGIIDLVMEIGAIIFGVIFGEFLRVIPGLSDLAALVTQVIELFLSNFPASTP